MCRFVAFLGRKPLILSELIEKPENSLIEQSHKAKSSDPPLNADGFGISWYNFSIDTKPGIFKSIQPAWNDANLKHLTRKIESPCFLSHVRASTIGEVCVNNCHPFSKEAFSFAHNGTIRQFDKLKRALLQELDDDLFLSIKGNTDSEYLFALIMQHMKTGETLISSVQHAIDWITDHQETLTPEVFARINMAITNGEELVATRFASKSQRSLSLYYAVNITSDTPATETIDSLVVSSEPLNEKTWAWHEIPENTLLHIDKKSFKLTTHAL